MDTLQRASQDVRDEWEGGVFDKPGTDKDRRRLLNELVAMHKDATACELVNALADEGERGAYALHLVATLVRTDIERARPVLAAFRKIDCMVRFAANLALYTKSGDDRDLHILRTVAGNMQPPGKTVALLAIYGLTMNTSDLVPAFRAEAAPVVKRYRDWRG